MKEETLGTPLYFQMRNRSPEAVQPFAWRRASKAGHPKPKEAGLTIHFFKKKKVSFSSL